MKKPQPHQQKALKAIQKGLRFGNRGKVLMATGTGKTLVALWAARQHSKDSILVLVPSLALARQVYQEWRDDDVQNNVKNSDWLVVCSDTSVVEEETPEELEASKQAIE